jgi:DNA replication and repair protein RecF
VWDEKIIGLGTEITYARLAAVSALREPLAESYESVAGSAQLTDISLASKIHTNLAEDATRDAIAEKFTIAMIAALDDDVDRGTTSIGPHRDDVSFVLNDLPVKGYASHGETWSFALALKLAMAELFRHDSLGDPILILDDVFAELDESRRQRLTLAIRDFEQVIITAAVENDVPDVNVQRTIRIDAGRVSEEHPA